MDLPKAGGASAWLMATTYLIALALHVTVLDLSSFTDPLARTAHIVSRQGAFTAFVLVAYVAFAAWLVVFATALHDEVGIGDPALAKVGTVFAFVWATLLVGSGLVYKVGLTAVATLQGTDPQEASLLLRVVNLVHEGIGCSVEIPGGLWMILTSLAGLRSGRHHPALHRLGIFLGACGVLTVVPWVYVPAVALFALGSVVWFFWWGGLLLCPALERSPSRTPILTSLLLGFALLAPQAARAEGWKTETSKDRKVVVTHRISDVVDPQGGKTTLVEYTSVMTETIDWRKCLAVLRDPSRHATIHDDESSRTVRAISGNERIVHYQLKMPWPLPKTDCVLRMVVREDSAKGLASVTLEGAPDEIPMTDSRRIRVYSTVYELKDLGGGRTELKARVRVRPPFELPRWILATAFPEDVAKPLKKITQLAAKER
jgi:hypothetical protein